MSASVRERYDNLDGLRAISCLAIIAMHIRANHQFALQGWVYDTFIASWTHLVCLFLMISGFGMFCGYYDSFRAGSADLNRFYGRRYQKLLPFFAFLMAIDVVLDRSCAHLIEALTQSTLVFGLLPNNAPEVIGVGWTLGVIFLFYMLFPFAVFLCWSRRRAWMALAVSVALNLFCLLYYFSDTFVISGFSPRHSFLYCAPFFLLGGVIYLNRGAITAFVRRRRWLCLGVCFAATALWYVVPGTWAKGFSLSVKNLALFGLWLCYALSVRMPLLSNPVMHYLSGISMELYLAQMVVFRAIEKLGLANRLGNGWVSFLGVWLITVMGLIAFIEAWKRAAGLIRRGFASRRP